MTKHTKGALIIEQHRHHGEAIYADIKGIFDEYQIASSLAEASALTERFDFDMIIINPFFPDGSGRIYIKSLKENVKTQNIPIVVTSDLPEKTVKLDFYAVGADAYFEMPYDIDKFRATVQEKLNRHVKVLLNNGIDTVTGFMPRNDFEAIYRKEQQFAADVNKELALGIVAPVGIDFVIRDYGLEAGDKLMSVLSRLMRGMCKQELKASMWTQKSIVFIVPDKNILEIKKGLELIRKKYLEEMKDITKLQLTPGLRVVLDKMSPELPLVGAVDRMINQLIIMSRNENLESIAFYAEYQSLKKHIIIADPDPVSVNVIRHRLSREGYIVEKADSAEKLLTHPALNDIAALLVDSAVSGGGIGMVKELRREAAIKDIPIMLLSRYGHEEEISEAFEAGVRDYLLKPFSPVELSARIKRLTA